MYSTVETAFRMGNDFQFFWFFLSELQSEDFNEGKLLLYNRAELKTSDHRPVLAIIDAEVMLVDETKREDVYSHVIDEQGPPDGTVIVSLPNGEEFNEEQIENILGVFQEIGDLLLVR